MALRFRHVYVDHILLLRFIDVFSRVEFALKSTSSFARGDENGVSPDWQKFAIEIRQKFNRNRNPVLKAATEYLLTKPPKKQVLINNVLSWKDVLPECGLSDAENLQLIVGRVRNNLFHGGKVLVGGASEPGRDEDLIRYCLTVLEEFVALNSDVQAAFEQ